MGFETKSSSIAFLLGFGTLFIIIPKETSNTLPEKYIKEKSALI